MATMTTRSRDLLTLLLSAEECADCADEEWIREATPEEIDLVKGNTPEVNFDDLALDRTGRPYWWRTVDVTKAPEHVAEKARSTIRVFRWR